MADSNATNGSNDRSSRRFVPSFDSLLKLIPGTTPNAPKRNVLVALAYLLLAGLAVGLLDWLP